MLKKKYEPCRFRSAETKKVTPSLNFRLKVCELLFKSRFSMTAKTYTLPFLAPFSEPICKECFHSRILKMGADTFVNL